MSSNVKRSPDAVLPSIAAAEGKGPKKRVVEIAKDADRGGFIYDAGSRNDKEKNVLTLILVIM